MRRGLGEFEEEEQREEREITLGTGLLIIIGCGVLALCCLSFWSGLSMGRNSAVPVPKPTAQSATPAGAPVPASTQQSSLSKPLAAGVVPTPPPEPAVPAETQPFGGQQSPADHALTSYAPVGAEAAPQEKPVVKPALPSSSTPASSQPEQPSIATQTPAAASGFMVEIAALAQVEDARVLMNALQQHGFKAVATRNLTDGLIHVRVGPFTTRAEAASVSQKLEGDGYNAQVQP